MKRQIKSIITITVALLMLTASQAFAGYTETLNQGMFLIDEAFTYSWIDTMWDNDGNKAALIEEVERYEPGGGKQGVLYPEPKAEYMVLINKLQYGILENLTFVLAIPVVLHTKVDPRFRWEEGDYMRQLGRAYSEQDFWDWAQSMGQSKPETWVGNKGVLSDIVIGARFRWTDYIEKFEEVEIASAVTITGIIPTGRHTDEEEVVAAGTTMWDLQSQGDLGFHVSFDKKFKKKLDGRLTIGLDVFYELFFDRELTAPVGKKHPLLLNLRPFVGDENGKYKVNPGDFAGAALKIDGVVVKGPAWGTWLSGGDKEKAEKFPPLLAVSANYSFVHLQQTDYKSNSDIWDWDKEKLFRPGYRNILSFDLTFSFFRLGAPLQIYGSYRTLTLIPGKNTRAADSVTAGIRIPLKFW